ncbi:hypothetical protein MesoLjLc_52930 [Mesorhizobium sp. L-8-10]|nr:hypothetical protein MesoLjLc_52930 [Mesorhizobium sp. L-8-10]
MLRLRPERDEDEAFRYRLFCESRTKEWDPVRSNAVLFEQLMQHQFRAQTVGYRSQFPKARFDIVELDGRPIGRVVVDRPGTMIHVVDLAIVPSLRNRGIGTAMMQSVIDEAQHSGVPIQLYVSSENDPSLRLYLRLGFAPIVSHPSYILLERQPGGDR